MTLDEAIKHCLEVAGKEEQFCVQDDISCRFQKSHAECAADHRQLAEWLKELQELKLQIAAPRLGSIEEYHYELARCKTAFWSCNRRCMDAEEQYRRKADELRKAQEQIAEYNQIDEQLGELEAKHWDECRQISHYDDELHQAIKRAIINNGRAVLTNMDNLDLHDENRELKRLLKAAVEDFREINSDILTCRYCRWYSVETDECAYCPDDVPCERICGWKHEAEA